MDKTLKFLRSVIQAITKTFIHAFNFTPLHLFALSPVVLHGVVRPEDAIKRCFPLLLAFLCSPLLSLYAAVPQSVVYQGKLSDASGNVKNGSFDFRLKLYDASTSGTLLLSDEQTAVGVTNGVYTLSLGQGTLTPGAASTLSGALSGSSVYLEIEVKANGDPSYETLSPRIRLESSPYALRAEKAEAVSLESGDFTLTIAGTELLRVTSSSTIVKNILDLQNNRLINLASPSLSGDAATKGYVDSTTGGLGAALLISTQTFSGGNVFSSWSVFSGSITALNALNRLAGDGAAITNLDAGNIASGLVSLAQIPSLPAGQITSGTFGDSFVAISTAAVASGKFADDRVAISTAAIAQGKFGDDKVAISLSAVAGLASELSRFDQVATDTTTIQGSLSGEIAARAALATAVASDTTTLKTELTAESTARSALASSVAADTSTLKTELTAESTARSALASSVASDTTTLKTSLDAETSARSSLATAVATDTTTLKTSVDANAAQASANAERLTQVASDTTTLQGSLTNEITARAALASAVASDTTTLKTELTAESTARSALAAAVASDTTTLKTSLNAETAARSNLATAVASDTTTLKTELTAESTTRSALASAVATDTTTLKTSLNAETSARGALATTVASDTTTLKISLDAETAARSSLATSVASDTTTIKTSVDANAAQASANAARLTQVASDTTTIQGSLSGEIANRQALASAVASDTTTLKTSLDAETSARSSLATAVATDTTTLKTSVDANAAQASANAARLTQVASDTTTLKTSVDANAAQASANAARLTQVASDTTTLQGSLTNEIAARAALASAVASDTTTLKTELTAESTARSALATAVAADTTTLKTSLNAETSARGALATAVASDTTTLKTSLNAETSARGALATAVAADTTTLKSDITTETTTRQSLAAAVASDTTTLKTSIDAKVNRSGDSMSGQLTIGSTLTVTGNAFSVGGSTFVVKAGNVGIGTSAPAERLEIDGNIQISNGKGLYGTTAGAQKKPLIRGVSSTVAIGDDDAGWNEINFNIGTPPVTKMAITSSGNVGIGIAGPAARLDVEGNAQFGSEASKSTFTAAGALTIASGSNITLAGGGELLGLPATPSGLTAAASKAYVDNLSITTGGGWTDTGAVVRLTSASDSIGASGGTSAGVTFSSHVFVTPGNVGIGTSNPLSRLHVTGDIFSNGGDVQVDDGRYIRHSNNWSRIQFNGTDVGSNIQFFTNASARAVIDGSGNLGIGTAAPTHKLRVEGGILASSSVTASSFHGDGSNLTGVQASALADTIAAGTMTAKAGLSGITVSTGLFITAGNVGIGTANPADNLHVFSSAPTTFLKVENTNSTAGGGDNGAFFHAANNTGITLSMGVQRSNTTNATLGLPQAKATVIATENVDAGHMFIGHLENSPNGTIRLVTGGAIRQTVDSSGNVGIASSTPQGLFVVGSGTMVVTSAGNVGIGTTAPSQKLDVNGTAQVAGFKMPTGATDGYVLTSNAAGLASWAALPQGIQTSDSLTWTGAQTWQSSSTFTSQVGVSSHVSVGGNLLLRAPNREPGTAIQIDGDFTLGQFADIIARSYTGTGGGGTDWQLSKASGTPDNPQAISAGFIGAIDAGGYTGAGFNDFRARIIFNAAENWSTTAQGTNIQFRTTQAGGTAGGVRMTISDSGNVGIGTTGPAQKLELSAGNILLDRVPTGSRFVGIGNGNGDLSLGSQIEFEGFGDTSAAMHFLTHEVGVSFARRMSIDKSGNLGVGTTAPTHKLRVEGGILATSSVTASSFHGDGSGLTGVQASALPDTIAAGTMTSKANLTGITVSTSLFVTSGNVGIGTTAPFTPLHIKGLSAGLVPLLTLQNFTGGGGAAVSIDFNTTSVAAGANPMSRIEALDTGNGSNDLLFITRIPLSPNLAERVRITETGNVGIGTSAPGSQLSVSGSAEASASFLSPLYKPLAGDGNSLNLQANASSTGNGGAANFTAGTSPSAPSGQTRTGGSVVLTAGGNSFLSAVIPSKITLTGVTNANGVFGNATGGITLAAGDGASADGGKIVIGAGNLDNNRGGDLTLDAGQGNSGSGHILLSIAGAEKARLHSGGNLGIGTASPETRLTVVGGDLTVRSGADVSTITATGFAGDGSGLTNVQASALADSIAADTLTAKAGLSGVSISTSLFVTAGGVGIGTAPPSGFKLAVNLDTQQARFFGSGANSNGLLLQNTNVTTQEWALYALGNSGNLGPAKGIVIYDVTNSKAPFEIERNAPDHTLYLRSTGNVGVGTSAPTHRLRVEGGILAASSVTASSFHGDGSDLSGIQAATLSDTVTASTLTAKANLSGITVSTGLFVSAGNMGIGTTSPSNRLSVSGTADFSTSVKTPLLSALSGDGNSISIQANTFVNGTGGSMSLSAGNGGGGGGGNIGGSISVSGGSSGNSGGPVTISGGNAVGGTTGSSLTVGAGSSLSAASANVSLQGGNVGGGATGAGLSVNGGTTGGSGGGVSIAAGSNNTGGGGGPGSITLTGGSRQGGTGTGGEINLQGGSFSGGARGAVVIQASGGNVGIASSTPQGLFVIGSGTMVVTSAGNVGIGTTAPSQKLDVSGTVKATAFEGDGSALTSVPATPPAGADTQLQFNSGGSFGASSNLTWDNTNFRLGVGTTTPAVGIDLVGSSVNNGLMRAINANGTGSAGFSAQLYGTPVGIAAGLFMRTARGTLDSPAKVLDGDQIGLINVRGHDGTAFPSGGRGAITFRAIGDWSASNHGTAIDFATTSSGTLTTSTKMRISDSGKVGINTTGPGAQLDVVGTSATNDPVARFGTSGLDDGNSLSVRNGTGAISLFVAGNPGVFVSGALSGDGGIRVGNAQRLFFIDNSQSRMVLDPSGNAGIGTTIPTHKLRVEGGILAVSSVTASSFHGDGSGLTGVQASALADTIAAGTLTAKANLTGITVSTGLFVTAGNVGIGTAAPGERLVVGIGTGAGAERISIKGGTSPGAAGGINWFSGSTLKAQLEFQLAGASDSIFDYPNNLKIRAGAGGSTTMLLQADRSVGIGTLNAGDATARLHVFAANAQDLTGPLVKVENQDVTNGQGQGLLVQAGNGTSDFPLSVNSRAGASLLAVRADGNVGIGTTNPAAKLAVVGGDVTVGSGANVSTISATGFAGDGTNLANVQASTLSDSVTASTITSKANLTGVRISTSIFVTAGNVGIGTTIPEAGHKLHLVGGGLKLNVAGEGQTRGVSITPSAASGTGNILSYINTNGLFDFGALNAGTGAQSVFIRVTSQNTATPGNSAIAFYTSLNGSGGSERMRINGDGNVGVGTSAPSSKLQVADAASSVMKVTKTGTGAGDLTLVNDGSSPRMTGPSGQNLYLLIEGNSIGATGLTLHSAGNVGIGTTAPGAALDVNGNAQFGSGAGKSTFSASGDLTLASGQPVIFTDSNNRIFGSGLDLHLQGNDNIVFRTENDVIRATITASGGLEVSGAVTAANFTGSGAGLTNITAGSLSGSPTFSTLTVTGSAFSVGGSTMVVTGGNVGIGATSPVKTLHVLKTNAGGATNPLVLTNQNSNAGTAVGIQFNPTTLTAEDNYIGNILVTKTNAAADFTARMDLIVTNSAGTAQTGLSVLGGTSANVGIGTTNPGAKMEVANSAGAQSILTLTPLAGSANNTAPLFNVRHPDNFNSTAFQVLQSSTATSLNYAALTRNVRNLGDYVATDGAGKNIFAIEQSGSNVALNNVAIDDLSASGGNILFESGNFLTLRSGGSGSLILNDPSGNVGIGTSAPSSKLDVFNGSITVRGTNAGISVDGSPVLTSATGASLTANQTFSGQNTFTAQTAVSSHLFVTAGNVGIGTTAPGARFDVKDAGANLFAFWASTSPDRGGIRVWGAGSTTPGVVSVGQGSAGITVTPNNVSLQVFGSQNISSNAQGAVSNVLTVQNPNSGTATNNAEARVRFQTGTTSNGISPMASVGGLVEDVGTGNGALILTSGSGGTLTEKMRITSAGNAGIGTTAPGAKLHLSGDAQGIATNIKISGGDGTAGDDGGGVVSFANNNVEKARISMRRITADGSFPLNFFVGDVVSPDMTILADGNVGIASTTPQGLFVVGSGTMVVTAAGRVGIGTTIPNRRLHVQSPSGSADALTLSNSDFVFGTAGTSLQFAALAASGNTAYGIQTWNGGETAQGNLLLQRFGGNVGVGATNPATKLAVEGGDLTVRSGANVSTISATGFAGDGSNLTNVQASTLADSIAANTLTAKANLSGITVSTGLFVTAGNAGIGTSIPSAKLDVAGSIRRTGTFYPALWREEVISSDSRSGNTLISQLSQNYVMNAQSNDSGSQFRWYNAGGAALSSVDLTALTPLMSLNSSGNVGIGTSIAGNRLSVSGSSDFSGNVAIGTTTTSSLSGFNKAAIVSAGTSGDVNAGLELQGSRTTDSTYAGISAFHKATQAAGISFDRDGADDAGAISFITRLAGSNVFERMRITNGGEIGIGTSTPKGLLHVGAGATPGLLVTSGGNVGIGTTLPASPLEVRAGISGNILRIATSLDGGQAFDIGIDTGTKRLYFNPDSTLPTYDFAFLRDGGNTSSPMVLFDQSTGNVGIGTTSPDSALEVAGQLRVTNSGQGIINEITSVGHHNWQLGGSIHVASGFEITPSTAVNGFTFDSPALVILNNGNVGVGATNPATRLAVEGGDLTVRSGSNVSTISATGFAGDGSNLTNVQASTLADSIAANTLTAKANLSGITVSTGLFVTAGNVGIGTSAPGAKLHLSGDAQGIATNIKISGGDGTAGDDGGGVVSFANNNVEKARISMRRITADGSFPLNFFVGDVVSPDMTILAGGNVGIGTANPTSGDGSVDRVLHVLSGVAANASVIQLANNDNSKFLQFWSGRTGDTSPGVAYPSGESLRFGTLASITGAAGWNEKVRIDSTGNVGIGTTAPSTVLHLGGLTGGGLTIGQAGYTEPSNNHITFSNSDIAPPGFLGHSRMNFELSTNTRKDISQVWKVPFDTAKNSWNLRFGIAPLSAVSGFHIEHAPATAGTPVFVNYLTIEEDGNVGVGAISPVATLHVSSAATAATTPLFIVSTGTAASQELFRIRKDGKVGIGTTIPNRRLHVQSPSGSADVLTLSNSDFVFGTAGTSLQFAALAASGNTAYGIQTWNGGETAQGNLLLQRFGGNVGVGATNPATKLAVEGGDLTVRSGANVSTISATGFAGNGSNLTNVQASTLADSIAANTLTAKANLSGITVSTGLFVTAGSVGIGTTNPTHALHIASPNNTPLRIDTSAGIGGFVGHILFSNSIHGGDLIRIGFNDVAPKGLVLQTLNTANNKDIVLAPNESPAMTVQSGGNVGIGTTNPAVKLDVVGGINIQSNNNLTWGGAFGAGVPTISGVTSSGLSFYPTGSTSGIAMHLNASGNVGIGTESPSAKLQVKGPLMVGSTAVTEDGLLSLRAAADGQGILLRESYAGNQNLFAVTQGVGDGGGAKLEMLGGDGVLNIVINSSPTANSYINNGGNVGIGTTAPSRRLHVQTGSADTDGIVLSSGTAGAISSTWAQDIQGRHYFGTTTNHPLQFYTNGTAKVTIQGDGNVGIGTTAALAKLDVSGAGPGNSSTLKLSNTNGKTWQLGEVQSNNQFEIFDTAVGPRMVIDSLGNIGVGTAGPGAKLHLSQGNLCISDSGYPCAGLTGRGLEIARVSGSHAAVLFNHQDSTWTAGVSNSFPHFAISEGTDINANARLVIKPSSGNVGISTTNPQGLFVVGNGTMVVTSAGNVGIGTTNPGSINSVAFSAADLHIAAGAGSGLVVDGSGQADIYWNNSGQAVNSRLFQASAQSGNVQFRSLNDAGTLKNEILTMTTGGNVGVGTTAPGAKLHVAGAVKIVDGTQAAGRVLTSDVNGLASWSAAGSGDASLAANQTFTGQNTFAAQMSVSSHLFVTGGNVGIGTASPGTKLDAAGYVRFLGQAGVSGNPASGEGLELTYDSSGNVGFVFAFDRDLGTARELRLGGAGTAVTINSNGNVGVGTMTPAGLLEANSTSGIQMLVTNTATANGANYWLRNTADNASAVVGLVNEGSLNKALGFYTGGNATPSAGTERMRISSTGNVGIGTTAPTKSLSIKPATDDHQLHLSQNNVADGWFFHAESSLGDLKFSRFESGVATERMRIRNGGNVGVGTTNPTAKLQVETSGGSAMQMDTSNSAYVSLKVNGVEVARMKP